MLARSWALGFVCAFCGVLAGATAGCSSKSNPGTTDTADAGRGESKTGASSISNYGVVDDEDDAGRSDAGSAAESDAGSGCNPNAVDDPDDDFADTNCDGIDGDKRKAIFVATTGNDSADGTWGKPVVTLTHAIALATAACKDVYVCAGDYQENLSINAQGARVYGGYDCAHNWQRNSTSQARIVSATNSALIISNSKQPVVFDHVDIGSADASAGNSSVAVFVSKSSQVTLRRGTMQAGAGADAVVPTTPAPAQNSAVICYTPLYLSGCYGEPGTDAYQYGSCFLNSQAGSAYNISRVQISPNPDFALASSSDISQRNECKNSLETYGGKGGGTNQNNPQLGSDGTQGSPPSTTGTLNGADGSAGQPGAAATQTFGTLSESGYVASNQGANGFGGNVGESGTGGNGGGFGTIFSAGTGDFPYYLYAPRAGGGKGGFGGCAGDGGPGGNAGGASIAVASYQSQVTIERATLTTSKGGKGSAGAIGGDGADGQPGGPCGVAHYECPSCASEEAAACPSVAMTNDATAQSGGKGGKGGKGGQGGPGGGGPSIPLFVSGTVPTLAAVTFLPGSGGPGGSNGGPRAADGESTDQKVVP